MLTVTFNLRDGTFTDIPDDAHELIIEGYDKLTSSQQVLLKRYIIKHQLDISLQHGVPSSPLHSLNIIKTLRTFEQKYIILVFTILFMGGALSYSCLLYPSTCLITFQTDYNNMWHPGYQNYLKYHYFKRINCNIFYSVIMVSSP